MNPIRQSVTYTSRYRSPLGEIILASDGHAITGLWFVDQRYFMEGIPSFEERDLPILDAAHEWLDAYFTGEEPPPISYKLPDTTPFRKAVWAQIERIPRGETVTYGHIANVLSETSGKQTSARAVGGAVGHNPISIIVPCHRVIGSDGRLTGYSGGIDRKSMILKLEGYEFQ